MNKLTASALVLIFSVIFVSVSNIGVVKAEGVIFIRADGSVEGTKKIQRDGNTYTFLGNISIDASGIDGIIVERDNIVIDGAGNGLQGNGNENGIVLSNVNITVKNLKLSNFNIGIVVKSSENNKILENIITANFRGLDLTASENNIVSGNYIANNNDGIALENINNEIIENTITDNTNIGIFLNGAGYNNIIENNITNNGRGILVSICYNNVIHHNNFVKNTKDVETDSSINTWDNNFEGNYWSDYDGEDNDADGIGDTPYIINENNQDNHPLVNIISEFKTIYIRADGTVDGTGNIHQEKNIYTLTGNIYDPLVIKKDNIIIDGSNYTLQGTGTNRGIELSDKKNVTLKNFEITGFETGIYIYDHSEPRNNTISANIITNNTYGIYIEHAHNNTISGNTITNNEYGIYLQESRFDVLRNNSLTNNCYSFTVDNSNFVNDVDTSNLVDGKPMIYWINQQDKTVPSEAGYVALINCENITIENLTLDNNGQGMLLISTIDSTIANNTITTNVDGILLRSSLNNTISENNLTHNKRGIHIIGSWENYSLNNSISGNFIANNEEGIHLFETSNNVFRNNKMINNNRSFVDTSFFVNDLDSSNTVNGKPIYYWVNKHDKTVPSDAGYVALLNCVNITVQNLELSNEDYGIILGSTINSTIANNIINNNSQGIYLTKSNNNTIRGNYITNNNVGIWFYDSSNNIIFENYVANNQNGTSILLLPFMPTSSNNIFYCNSFVNNVQQIYEFPSGFAIPDAVNSWDNGVEGNYWSDYEGTDSDSDGIGEIFYFISKNNQDNYPLMASIISPIYGFDAGIWEWIQYNVYVISNSSVSDFIFNPENTLIQFNVEGKTGTTGFCNVTIPKNLLYAENTWVVLVDGTSLTPTVNEKENYTTLHFTYAHDIQTIQIIGTDAIPEFPTWAILPILCAIPLVAVIGKQKLKQNANKGVI
ncbi:MAG: right-handed parallel beta-helix repeat-containing protein [Candidatus Bathyarchaeota archaeon]|nr:right-handed parallel beta-helix repeat-containing protein [Candidatus Bathyarchaeum sp.]